MNSLELLREFDRRYYVDDHEFLEVSWASCIANALPGENIWLKAVGPPSSMKSTVLRAMSKSSHVITKDGLTEHTLITGFEGATSLLNQLDKKVLVIPDTTNIENLPAYKRAQIFGQLRGAYDGSWDFGFGTRTGIVKGEGKFGMILGSTPKSESDSLFNAWAGERFITCRLKGEHRKEKARRALESSGQENEMHKEVTNATTLFMRQHWNAIRPHLHDANIRDELVDIADFVTRARTPVPRDGYSRDVARLPSPEEPPRFAKQLARLAESLAKIRDERSVTKDQMLIVRRVAQDCVPPERLQLMGSILAISPLTVSDAMEMTGLGRTTVNRILEDLTLLELVDVERKSAGTASLFMMNDDAKSVLVKMLAGSRPDIVLGDMTVR